MGTKLDTYIENVKERSPRERAKPEAAERSFDLIGQLIARRLHAGLTQEQLANRSGIHQSEISKIERGRINPTKETLDALAAALGAHLALVSDKEREAEPIGA
jgi:ribosome-binding protein aMBF1 (putative translation factor)